MRFPGKRLIAGLKQWRRHAKADPAEDINAAETDEHTESGPEVVKRSLKVATESNTAVEVEPHPEPEPVVSSLESAQIEEAVKSDVEPAHVKKAAPSGSSEEKPTPLLKARLPRVPPQPDKRYQDDELISDKELAELEAENARLKRLLEVKLSEENRKSCR